MEQVHYQKYAEPRKDQPRIPANSLLESYNARVKKILPYKPNWPIFAEFIAQEESHFNLEILRKVTQGEMAVPQTKKTVLNPNSNQLREALLIINQKGHWCL